MKPFYTTAIALCIVTFACAQEQDLPRYLTDSERAILPTYQFPRDARSFEEPPPFENIRNMAEWEEVQVLAITWRSYTRILKEITRAAKEETKVIIFCSNTSTVQSYLMGTQGASGSWPSLPPLNNMDNIELIVAPTNSVWMRDYGANNVYGNRVDTLALVDWIYNRPRPADDVIPSVLADHLGLNLYTTTQAPSDLVNTGGNFMSDGQGTGFASSLILEENEVGNPYDVTPKNEEEINDILGNFQGLSRYIKMEALPYDIINHIDMHIKLLDEETLLVGEYPEGVADGPQINANIDYVVNNFMSTFGEAYKIVRIPMPDATNGSWPDDNPAASYRTYTNGVFINKTYIYPTYRAQYDTTAARIYSELLPGYNLVTIDCDNSPEAMISAAGAIHCITHTVGVNDPLLIVHQALKDTEETELPYVVVASAEHRSGVASTKLWWRLSGETEYNEVEMNPAGGNNWQANIPAQPAGTKVQYYVQAFANNGKTLNRPIVAPEGYWQFTVFGGITAVDQAMAFDLRSVYPNPATDIVSIPVFAKRPMQAHVYLTDITGRPVAEVFSGEVYGDKRISMRVGHLASGTYIVVVDGDFGRRTTPLAVVR